VRPLTPGEIVDRERYAALRDDYRDAVIAYKRRRRVALGDRVTLLFEDRETLRFQVQEMLFVEGIREPERVCHELDVYNELMPTPRELSATLFIEITEPERIRSELDRLLGLDERVALGLGEGSDARWIRASFDRRQLEAGRISAVHYLRFAFDEDAAARLADPRVRGRLRCDHPNYRCESEIPAPVRESLIAGLAGEPAPLLAASGAAAQPELLFSGSRVRALRPAGAGGHVVVEPLEPVASLLEVGDDLLGELMQAVRRAAAWLVERHGACRIQVDVGRGASGLRWHLRAPEG
jgi:hypothetical protein